LPPTIFTLSIEGIPVEEIVVYEAVMLGKAAGIIEETVQRLSAMGTHARDLTQHIIEGLPHQFGFGDAEGFGLALEGAVLQLGDIELLANHRTTIHHIHCTDEESTHACSWRFLASGCEGGAKRHT
jgi:hypothetical protein